MKLNGYEWVMGIFKHKMPKSEAVQLEPPPKGLAYIPRAFIRNESEYILPVILMPVVFYEVSTVWLDKAKIPAVLRFTLQAYIENAAPSLYKSLVTVPAAPTIRRRGAPEPSKPTEPEPKEEKRDAFDDLFARRKDEAEW